MDGRPRTPSTPHPCHGRSAPNSFDAAAMASYARSACGVGGLGELRRHLPPPPSPPTRTAGSRSPLLFRVCRQGGAAPDAGRSSSRGCGGAAPAAGRSSSRGCGGAAQSAGRSRLEAIAAGQKEPEGVPTTFLSFLIYCMTHHQEFYVAKSNNNYLTTIRDALKASPTTVNLVLVNFPPRT
ncbi:uncharacterized protein LOC119318256 isoform X3 [Triticum dicoccoides]|uniref:uncharacterized protein LOC119318256 isoform X3 n=1 Tax=Triticum dicoccoides TaxID=85692 RepID=UPI001890C9AF|nr:uncharacterized protein LOC119318256 isoform X3 [Triticum dicoccoides]